MNQKWNKGNGSLPKCPSQSLFPMSKNYSGKMMENGKIKNELTRKFKNKRITISVVLPKLLLIHVKIQLRVANMQRSNTTHKEQSNMKTDYCQ